MRDGILDSAGLRAGAVRVQVNEGVEFPLQGSDAAEVRFGKLYGRKLFGADACADFRDTEEGERGGHSRKLREYAPSEDRSSGNEAEVSAAIK